MVGFPGHQFSLKLLCIPATSVFLSPDVSAILPAWPAASQSLLGRVGPGAKRLEVWTLGLHLSLLCGLQIWI